MGTAVSPSIFVEQDKVDVFACLEASFRGAGVVSMHRFGSQEKNLNLTLLGAIQLLANPIPFAVICPEVPFCAALPESRQANPIADALCRLGWGAPAPNLLSHFAIALLCSPMLPFVLCFSYCATVLASLFSVKSAFCCYCS